MDRFDPRAWLLGWPRGYKRLLQVAVDIVLTWLALWLAFWVRLGSDKLVDPFGVYAWLFLVCPLIAIPIYIRLGMYRAVLRYLGNDALLTIFRAVTLSSLVLALVVYWYRDVPAVVPRSLVFNFWWLSLLMTGSLRLLMRHYFMGDWFNVRQAMHFAPPKDDGLPKAAIYGAGTAGNQLVAALRMGRTIRPVAFIDDDASLNNRTIAGLKVYRPKYLARMIEETGAQQVLLAMPSVTRARRREILQLLEGFPLHIRTVPGLMDLASGRVRVDDIREVDIADLLGRDPVPPRQDLFERCIRGKVVLVTGAGGSIGAELCRQLLGSGPQTLLLFDHSEFNLYSIHAELEERVARESLPLRLVPLLGSVRDARQVFELMRNWSVDTVYHAAAYKHVPMVEHNVAEGVLNNVLGTLNTVQAAIMSGVGHFVLVSTDKAVRPTNVMGSTKRLAEMLLQALSREPAPLLFGDTDGVHRVNQTHFGMVRFGNVLGSSGSVIPRFREQIRRGGPVTVTHPHITRYFMTITEAAQLVIQAGAMGRGGDVFVLDMGQPVKIHELAERMIHLSGFSVRSERNPHGDIAIEFTGLRPGEKLYEELLIGGDASATEHPMILRAKEEYLAWEPLKTLLHALLDSVERGDMARVRQLLREAVHGYVPEGDIVDWSHQRRVWNLEERV
ncbi:polysaccharide biosynthesis protein [Pseudomonas indica]|uniref:NDP-sugar epimerase, includes UDP-GlcNAc-inverting 4,6-dehydratase FlaA1 and capsular polysaccharide biosynthesis protein EpsC n=1 Tax=Pseudomonas indica TaxID=137658 RepID=A0A1G8YT42_9PSED|nr:nucleoside-diphosphate sugar epimerase/dehydratase [Pseudomonas indica]PAU62173.1 hypothetical protein BZL42_07420 [Pseudomonas indica]SDK05907.1 NDP-sugar epimerase, includes UDP-GlcNAc-inverting 4,6-dehydratase FlaA1 and capsular polysaccharide biosynthesis protein EpsC [Pseudomonas indica]